MKYEILKRLHFQLTNAGKLEVLYYITLPHLPLTPSQHYALSQVIKAFIFLSVGFILAWILPVVNYLTDFPQILKILININVVKRENINLV